MTDRAELEAKLAELTQLSAERGLELRYNLAPLRSAFHNAPLTVEFERDGVLYTADWSRRLLSYGASKLQSDWDTSKIASTDTWLRSMENAGEKLARRLNRDFTNNFMMTSTRNLRNEQTGGWNVVHDWNTPYATTLEDALPAHCANGYLSKHKHAEQITRAYRGTSDVDDVLRAVERVTKEKDVYFWAPRREGSVVLSLSRDNGFVVVAIDGVVGGSARGVVVAPKKL